MTSLCGGASTNRHSSLRFVQDLDPGDRRIVDDGLECRRSATQDASAQGTRSAADPMPVATPASNTTSSRSSPGQSRDAPGDSSRADDIPQSGDGLTESESSELTPAQLKEIRERMLSFTRRIYEDIAVAARLSDAETEALLALLVDQQMRVGTASHNELMARNRAEIEAQIGASRAAAVGEYQNSMNARYEVEELRRELESAGMPMTEYQRRDLIKSAIAKGAHVPMRALPAFTGAESFLASGQELFARIEQRDQRMLEIAAPQS